MAYYSLFVSDTDIIDKDEDDTRPHCEVKRNGHTILHTRNAQHALDFFLTAVKEGRKRPHNVEELSKGRKRRPRRKAA